MRPRLHGIVLAILLLGYLGVSLAHLDAVPGVHQDEGWLASTGSKLAAEGVFGSDMWSGFHGGDVRHYWFMPVHPLLLGATFRMAGVGLVQARLTTVVLGLLVLLLTYTLGRRLCGPTVALLSVAFLLLVRLGAEAPNQVSGILLLDKVRISRYDVAVAVFGLASLHAYLSATESRTRTMRAKLALAGMLTALAGLSHVYGLFWFGVLIILVSWSGGSRRDLGALAGGFVVPVLMYVAYVVVGLSDWIGQTSHYGPRFDLLTPSWYWQNVSTEYQRYGAGLGSSGLDYILRPGVWASAIVLPASLVILATRALHARDRAARTIVVPALLMPAMFGVFIHLKTNNYLVTVLPLGALAAAWGSTMLWQFCKTVSAFRWARAALLLVLLAVCTEGAVRMAKLVAAGRTETRYDDFITEVRAHIPAGSRVLGVRTYWIGLNDLEYQAWLVPLFLSSQPTGPSRPLDELLDALAPDVVLIDGPLQAHFDAAPPGRIVRAWMARRAFVQVADVTSANHGQVHVYRRLGH